MTKQKSDYHGAVYTLRDSDGNVRYVGCTIYAHNPAERLYQHRSNTKTHIGRFIQSERKSGRDVAMVVEEIFDCYYEACRAEVKYIEGYRRLLGDRLLNKTHKACCVQYAPGAIEAQKALEASRP